MALLVFRVRMIWDGRRGAGGIVLPQGMEQLWD